MPEWTVTVILPAALLAALAGGVLFWRRRRQRNRRLEEMISHLKRAPKPGRVNALLQKIYSLIEKNIAAQDSVAAYQAVDLLKAAFGEGLIRSDEALFLAAVVIKSVRSKQLDIASAALDAYRQMLRRLPPEGVTAAAEQLGVIAAVLLREKHNFLAAKAADLIFDALERGAGDDRAIAAFTAVLKTIGILALRRKDSGLFREMTGRLAAAVADNPRSDRLAAEILGLSVVWLHRLVKNDDQAMFTILTGLVASILEKGLAGETGFRLFVKEWHNLAGTASLNPNSVLGGKITEVVLGAALRREAVKDWELAVGGAGQTARLAISRRGLEAAFPVLLPLMAIGRELLTMELKFGGPEYADGFRPQALFHTVRECAAIAEFVARKDMISSAGDIIADLNRCWTKPGVYSGHKASKRFCQLLLAYWLKTGRQAKRAVVREDLATPPLLSDEDKKKLAFL